VLRVIGRERFDIIRIRTVTHKASGGIRIKGNHEKESQVMCVPEGLETLITNLLVRSRVHNGHHKKHEMIGNSTSLRIVNLNRELRAELTLMKLT